MKVAAFQENVFLQKQAMVHIESTIYSLPISVLYKSKKDTHYPSAPAERGSTSRHLGENKIIFEARDSLCVYVYLHTYADLEYTYACIHT